MDKFDWENADQVLEKVREEFLEVEQALMNFNQVNLCYSIFANPIFQMSLVNSGDWIENLTALEYNNKEWKIYTYDKNDFQDEMEHEINDVEMKSIENLIKEVVAFN